MKTSFQYDETKKVRLLCPICAATTKHSNSYRWLKPLEVSEWHIVLCWSFRLAQDRIAIWSFATAFCLLFCRYEGTGRSLSLKLIQQLRQQSAQAQVTMTAENKSTATAKLASGTPLISGLYCASLMSGVAAQQVLLVSCVSMCSCRKVEVWENEGALLISFFPHDFQMSMHLGDQSYASSDHCTFFLMLHEESGCKGSSWSSYFSSAFSTVQIWVCFKSPGSPSEGTDPIEFFAGCNFQYWRFFSEISLQLVHCMRSPSMSQSGMHLVIQLKSG